MLVRNIVCFCLMGSGICFFQNGLEQASPPVSTVAEASIKTAAPLSVTEAGVKAAAQYHRDAGGEAFVVMRDGKIIFEQYDNGGAVSRPQMLASGSKSFVGLVAAAAVDDKIIALDDKASDAITEWKADPVKSKITYRQLLTLTSGLTAGERGNAIRAPAWKIIAAKPMTGTPGTQFEYGAYHVNTFAYALERKLKNETFEAYLKRRILAPLGITVEWRFRCDDGHPQVGGGAFVTARDWAKLGEFVRRNGITETGKPLISSAQMKICLEGTAQNPAYGLTWWLKKPVKASTVQAVPLLSREWGDVANSNWLPDDLVAACGAGKQRLYVIPSQKLVVVRQGRLSRSFEDMAFLNLLLHNGTATGYK